MSNAIKDKEKQLKILGDFFGFLAIIVSLFIPVIWDDMRLITLKEDRLYHSFLLELIMLILLWISLFYVLRFFEKYQSAELIAILLLFFFSLFIFLVTFPFLEVIIYNLYIPGKYANYSILAVFIQILLYITGLLMIIFSFKWIRRWNPFKEDHNLE